MDPVRSIFKSRAEAFLWLAGILISVLWIVLFIVWLVAGLRGAAWNLGLFVGILGGPLLVRYLDFRIVRRDNVFVHGYSLRGRFRMAWRSVREG